MDSTRNFHSIRSDFHVRENSTSFPKSSWIAWTGGDCLLRLSEILNQHHHGSDHWTLIVEKFKWIFKVKFKCIFYFNCDNFYFLRSFDCLPFYPSRQLIDCDAKSEEIIILNYENTEQEETIQIILNSKKATRL